MVFISISNSHLTINGHRHEAPISRLIHGPFLWLKLVSDIDRSASIIVYISPQIMPFYTLLFELISQQFPRVLLILTRFQVLYYSPVFWAKQWVELGVLTGVALVLVGSGIHYHRLYQKIEKNNRQIEALIESLSIRLAKSLPSRQERLYQIAEAARYIPGDLSYFLLSPQHFELRGVIPIVDADTSLESLNSLFSRFSMDGNFEFVSANASTATWKLDGTYGL